MTTSHFKIAVTVSTLFFVLSVFDVTAQSVLQVIKDDPRTSDFAAAIEQSGLESRLSSGDPYTIFVPSNNTFGKLPASQRSNKDMLLNHIITGTATERSLKYMDNITSLSGTTIEIVNMNGNSLSIQSYSLVESNIRASNGVVHIIDGVIK